MAARALPTEGADGGGAHRNRSGAPPLSVPFRLPGDGSRASFRRMNPANEAGRSPAQGRALLSFWKPTSMARQRGLSTDFRRLWKRGRHISHAQWHTSSNSTGTGGTAPGTAATLPGPATQWPRSIICAHCSPRRNSSSPPPPNWPSRPPPPPKQPHWRWSWNARNDVYCFRLDPRGTGRPTHPRPRVVA